LNRMPFCGYGAKKVSIETVKDLQGKKVSKTHESNEEGVGRLYASEGLARRTMRENFSPGLRRREIDRGTMGRLLRLWKIKKVRRNLLLNRTNVKRTHGGRNTLPHHSAKQKRREQEKRNLSGPREVEKRNYLYLREMRIAVVG